MVQTIKFNPELRYGQKELEFVLPGIPDEEPDNSGSDAASRPSAEAFGKQKGLALVSRRCLFIQHAKKDAKTLPEPDWYGMITNLAVFEGGVSVIQTCLQTYRPKISRTMICQSPHG